MAELLAGAGLRGPDSGGAGGSGGLPGPLLASTDLLPRPPGSALSLSGFSCVGPGPSATHRRRETSPRLVSCSWVCDRPHTFSSCASRLERWRALETQGRHLGPRARTGLRDPRACGLPLCSHLAGFCSFFPSLLLWTSGLGLQPQGEIRPGFLSLGTGIPSRSSRWFCL